MVPPEPVAPIGLEPSLEELRAVLAAAVDYVLGFLDRLPQAALSDRSDVAALLADEAVHRTDRARVDEAIDALRRHSAQLTTTDPR
jgi:hypothetical protein